MTKAIKLSKRQVYDRKNVPYQPLLIKPQIKLKQTWKQVYLKKNHPSFQASRDQISLLRNGFSWVPVIKSWTSTSANTSASTNTVIILKVSMSKIKVLG